MVDAGWGGGGGGGGLCVFFFFFKQKTAYEIYQCDWSSDVCSSDLLKKVFRNGSAIYLDKWFVLSETQVMYRTRN